MARVDEFLEVAEGPSEKVLGDTHPSDGAIFSLLVQVAYADGVIEEEEFELLQRLLPGRTVEDLFVWVVEQRTSPMPIEDILLAVPDADERESLLRLATHVAWEDSQLADSERRFLDQLKDAIRMA